MELSRDLMLGMIRRGSNGAEIMQILDLIANEASPVSAVADSDGDVVDGDTVVFDTVDADDNDVVNEANEAEVELVLAWPIAIAAAL